MCKYLTFAVMSLFLTVPAAGSGFADLADEVRIPLSDGWQLVEDSGAYPFRIARDDQSAELSIFKSVIASDEKIEDEQELKFSVDKVIEDVIMTLPDAQLVANTGYFDENRVWFDLDFISFDVDRDMKIRHRLKGVLYQHPDGSQILFSLWGKAIEGASASALFELRLMQDEFAYTGEARGDVFGSSAQYDWYLIGFLFALLMVMLFIYKRRRQQDKIAFSDEEHFWRCSCGRLNHNDNQACKRCGRVQPVEDIS